MVKVWSKPSCVQCNATYRKLNENGLEYEVEDLSLPENEAQLLAFKDAGLLQAPVVVPPVGEPWSGFRPDRIDELAML